MVPEGRLRTKAMECKRGLVRVNADYKEGRILIRVTRDGHWIETFELAGVDEMDRRFRTPKRGEIVLDITIENAKLYSLEVT
jgi:hypothetical protein